jgi:hypothetical protein
VHIAYQVFGGGAVDLVVIAGGFSHLELRWEEPDERRRARTYRHVCVRLGMRLE